MAIGGIKKIFKKKKAEEDPDGGYVPPSAEEEEVRDKFLHWQGLILFGKELLLLMILFYLS